MYLTLGGKVWRAYCWYDLLRPLVKGLFLTPCSLADTLVNTEVKCCFIGLSSTGYHTTEK